MEEHLDTIAVAFADVGSLHNVNSFGANGQSVPLQVAQALHEYLRNCPDWRVISTVNSPHGLLNVYRFSPIKGNGHEVS